MSDARALLAAIVADPADDTVRLAYADYIEEHGNSARAEFIRLQIAAERLHPNSNARAALESRAGALFAQHWLDWWGEVCKATGLPTPAPMPIGRLGRLAQRLGLQTPARHAYEVNSFRVVRTDLGSIHGRAFEATYRRGFPTTIGPLPPDSEIIPAWGRVSPLDQLILPDSCGYRFEGHFLGHIRAVTVRGYNLRLVDRLLEVPHTTQLESLILEDDGDPYEYDYLVTRFHNDLSRTLTAPRVRQLKRLAIHLWDDRAAEVVAGAENLVGLEALEVSLLEDSNGSDDATITGQRIAILARSPHLAGLKELTVRGVWDGAGLDAVLRKPTWAGLEKLDLSHDAISGTLEPLADADGLPCLAELRLRGFPLTPACVGTLVRSPLLKRLRHFSFSRGFAYHDYLYHSAFLDMVDPRRIETYALGLTLLSDEDEASLRAKFGDRFRLLNA